MFDVTERSHRTIRSAQAMFCREDGAHWDLAVGIHTGRTSERQREPCDNCHFFPQHTSQTRFRDIMSLARVIRFTRAFLSGSRIPSCYGHSRRNPWPSQGVLQYHSENATHLLQPITIICRIERSKYMKTITFWSYNTYIAGISKKIFVPVARLASAVLEELPGQVSDYFNSQRLHPINDVE
eukprot:sb/3471604/